MGQVLTAPQLSILVEEWRRSPVTELFKTYLNHQRDNAQLRAESLARKDADETADLMVQSKLYRELVAVLTAMSFVPETNQPRKE